jgi:hypothetical protein
MLSGGVTITLLVHLLLGCAQHTPLSGGRCQEPDELHWVAQEGAVWNNKV